MKTTKLEHYCDDANSLLYREQRHPKSFFNYTNTDILRNENGRNLMSHIAVGELFYFKNFTLTDFR